MRGWRAGDRIMRNDARADGRRGTWIAWRQKQSPVRESLRASTLGQIVRRRGLTENRTKKTRILRARRTCLPSGENSDSWFFETSRRKSFRRRFQTIAIIEIKCFTKPTAKHDFYFCAPHLSCFWKEGTTVLAKTESYPMGDGGRGKLSRATSS